MNGLALPRVLLLLAIGISASVQSQAQVIEASKPAYDVGSIKPNTTGRNGVSIHVDDNIYTAINISLKVLLAQAYGIREDLISGVPNWANSARFDIHAKVVEADRHALAMLNQRQQEALLQPVLVDRFQVKVHTETKILPVYELVVAKGGIKFEASSPADKNKRWHDVTAGGSSIHNGHLAAHQVPLSRLVNVIAGQMHRAIVDKTDLAGDYDLLLDWTPEDAPPSPDATAPILPTALEEQLGLKLVSSKGPVETLVIDHAELPTED
jgi:uncharacterized protein (TIGR03435 family)